MRLPALLASIVLLCGVAGCGGGGGGGGGGGAPGSGTGSAVSVMGLTFDPATSRRIWNGITLPTTQNWRDTLVEGAPERGTVVEWSADTVRGVACVKQVDDGWTGWFARDSAGRVVLIREQLSPEDGGDIIEPDSLAEAYYYPLSGTVGQTWVEDEEGDEAWWEIVATTATAPRSGVAGCRLFKITYRWGTPETDDDHTWYLWISSDQGFVESGDAVIPGDQTMYAYRETVTG